MNKFICRRTDCIGRSSDSGSCRILTESCERKDGSCPFFMTAENLDDKIHQITNRFRSFSPKKADAIRNKYNIPIKYTTGGERK